MEDNTNLENPNDIGQDLTKIKKDLNGIEKKQSQILKELCRTYFLLMLVGFNVSILLICWGISQYITAGKINTINTNVEIIKEMLLNKTIS
jgi:hypothetical protein